MFKQLLEQKQEGAEQQEKTDIVVSQSQVKTPAKKQRGKKTKEEAKPKEEKPKPAKASKQIKKPAKKKGKKEEESEDEAIPEKTSQNSVVMPSNNRKR